MDISPLLLPSAGQLLALEDQARHLGTGLQAAQLQGCWQLEVVWPKGSQRASAFSGWLLRGLAARLEIDLDGDGLLLCNAVNLGALELRFRGRGRLQGRRPLLLFSFDRLELGLGGRVLLQRELPAPAAKRMPFFALISRDTQGLLAARGRGGGLALWRLMPGSGG
ncbi:hypothetical protein KBY58_09570 [Cyanobium sp. HWJ4-Hawea]|nr:hypothetical protein [Cyanobium sp. HWJ4-Hawea]